LYLKTFTTSTGLDFGDRGNLPDELIRWEQNEQEDRDNDPASENGTDE
jgi:hypothetical protein